MVTAIIILNYNNCEDTLNCVESIEKYNSAPVKYIVVDNGSTKRNVVARLDEYFKKQFEGRYHFFDYETDRPKDILPYISFVVSQVNSGYAQGNNKGLEYVYADSEIDKVLIINNDILFIQDIIPQLSQKIDTIKDCAVLSPLLLKQDGESIDYNCARLAPSVWQIILPYFLMYKDVAGILTRTKKKFQILRKNPQKLLELVVPIELPSGSCMMIKKNLMQEIGGFDSHTFLYYEENILYKKFLKMNKQSYMIPSLKCIHIGASTTKKNPSMLSLRAGVESSKYYLENYCQLTLLHRIAMKVSYFNMRLKLRIKDTIKY